MASKYECEVRFNIKDVDKHNKLLQELGTETIYEFSSKDYYYTYNNSTMNLNKKNLRIRHFITPNEEFTGIYFVSFEILENKYIKFKRSIFEEGKLQLYSGPVEECKTILKELGFKEWFVVDRKKATFLNIPKYNFKTTVEYIQNYGWTGELEYSGENIEKARNYIKDSLKLMQISFEEASYKPLSLLFAEKNGLEVNST